jgi:predicted nucleic acid-binding protein
MRFADIPDATDVFLDANTFVYHFIGDAKFGAECTHLLKRIELREIVGWTSPHVLAEVSHRLMTIEACSLFGWSYQGIAARLRRHPQNVRQLGRYEQALREIELLRLRMVEVTQKLVGDAAAISRQHGLLTNDALVVTLMQSHALTYLASSDVDFDRIAGLLRCNPI